MKSSKREWTHIFFVSRNTHISYKGVSPRQYIYHKIKGKQAPYQYKEDMRGKKRKKPTSRKK